MSIKIIQERKYNRNEKNKKFFNFPYKALINKDFKIINSKNINEVFNEYKTIIYSPYCIKIYNSLSDIIFNPENKNSYGKII